MSVTGDKRRILYVEGEPRWEYKFIRRAEDDDKIVQVVSMLRTTENKIYRQGISDPKELANGFPVRAEDLFAYQGIIIGSVEAGYFTPVQQELLREFVDRRGGGLLFLGGRFSLADGGWGGSSLVDLLPTILPHSRNTFHRDPATVELTAAGADSPITPADGRSGEEHRALEEADLPDGLSGRGHAQAGATVLAQMNAGARKLPLLVTQNYGRGRTAVMATSGTWRWQMSQPLGDTAHDLFWQQLLRWLVLESPGHVVVTAPAQTLMDDGHVQLSAERARQGIHACRRCQGDRAYHRAGRHLGHGGHDAGCRQSGRLPSRVDGGKAGLLSGGGDSPAAGDKERWIWERDTLTFQRIDGVAENFHTEQNRELLEKLASETGGRYWKPDELIAAAERDLLFRCRHHGARHQRAVEHAGGVPVAAAADGAEWLLRRKWGVV